MATRWSLIESVVAGDETAEAEFVARYRPYVARYLTSRGLGAEAEDVAQDVFVRLLVKGGMDGVARGESSFRNYLFVVTRNALRDHVRRANAERRGGKAELVPLLDAEPSVAEREAFDREFLLNLLEHALARLEREHPNYYTAVKTLLWEGGSQAALAEASGRSVQDVRNHLHRGKRKLAAYIHEEVARCERDPTRFATEVATLAKLLERR